MRARWRIGARGNGRIKPGVRVQGRSQAAPRMGHGRRVLQRRRAVVDGLDANKQLIVQRASPAVGRCLKAARTGAGPLSLQWDSARTVDLAGDTVAADGEKAPKILFGPGAVAIAYTKPLTKPLYR